MIKRKLTIISKFFEQSATASMGWGYRYRVEHENPLLVKCGAFSIFLLPEYEEIFDINWRESYFIELNRCNEKL